MVFRGALFDSLTVRENVAISCGKAAQSDDRVNARVEEILGFIGLSSTWTRCRRSWADSGAE
jgi:ABC-type transporter Mla maintaining outer membrane lipid asymmetry ATPase subunit MlaF